jgi:hypothetical protein
MADESRDELRSGDREAGARFNFALFRVPPARPVSVNRAAILLNRSGCHEAGSMLDFGAQQFPDGWSLFSDASPASAGFGVPLEPAENPAKGRAGLLPRQRLPEDEGALWDWLIALDPAALADLIAPQPANQFRHHTRCVI